MPQFNVTIVLEELFVTDTQEEAERAYQEWYDDEISADGPNLVSIEAKEVGD